MICSGSILLRFQLLSGKMSVGLITATGLHLYLLDNKKKDQLEEGALTDPQQQILTADGVCWPLTSRVHFHVDSHEQVHGQASSVWMSCS